MITIPAIESGLGAEQGLQQSTGQQHVQLSSREEKRRAKDLVELFPAYAT